MPEHGGRHHQLLGRRLQPGHPGQQKAGQVPRHPGRAMSPVQLLGPQLLEQRNAVQRVAGRVLQERSGSAPGELASPQLPAERDDLGCSQRIKLETRRSLVTCEEAVPTLPVAGKLPRPCRHHHQDAVRQQAAQAEQQGARRQRIRPVQIVNQQQRQLARPPQRVEDRQQLGSHRQRVQALGQLAAQQRGRGHSRGRGRPQRPGR